MKDNNSDLIAVDLQKRPFPFSLHYCFFVLCAGIVVYLTVSDALFFWQGAPVVVDSTDNVNLEDNQLAEVQLEFDLDDGLELERDDDRFTVIPFKGTNRRLLFAIEGRLEPDKRKRPYRGRTATKGFADKWRIAGGETAKLSDLFPGGVPDDAVVVYPMDREGISLWQWTLTTVCVVFLIYTVFRWFQWSRGR